MTIKATAATPFADVTDTTRRTSRQAAHLLYWMTHRRTGSDGQFEHAAQAFLCDEAAEEVRTFTRAVRRRLQMLGHAHFEGGRWHVLPACLLLLPSPADTANRHHAVLAGARTPAWETQARAAAQKRHAGCDDMPLSHAPPRLLLTGSLGALRQVADLLAVPLITGAAMNRLAYVLPAVHWLTQAPLPLPTVNRWQIADMNEVTWRDLEAPDAANADRDGVANYAGPFPAALMAQPQAGPWRYFVALAPGQAVETPSAGDALLAAASGQGISLCRYDAERQWFHAPIDVPLEVARTLSLCSGLPPRVLQGEARNRVYRHVPPLIAEEMLRRLAPLVLPSASPPPARPSPVRWLTNRAF